MCVVGTLKIYALSNFQVYNEVLTIITILHIRSPELSHLITECFSLTNISLFLPPLTLGNHSVSMSLAFKILHISEIMQCLSLRLVCFTQYHVLYVRLLFNVIV